MRLTIPTSTSSLLLLFCTLITWASAVNVVSLNIARSSTLATRLRPRDIAKRDPILAPINNEGPLHGYSANITVGNPPQSLLVGVDTGSSDLWITSSTANLCTNTTLQKQLGEQCTGGTFDQTKSSTVEVIGTGDFNMTYYDGGGATGDFITDDFVIGNIKIEGLQMGLALTTTYNYGIMGLGYSNHETAATQYPNLIDQLVLQKKINTKAYSLYLDSLSESSGILLFGGIDTKKYTGSLSTLDILPVTQNPYTYTQFFVALQSMSLNYSSSNTTTIPVTSVASDGSTQNVAGALLDSGAAFALFPSSITKVIFTAFGAVESSITSGVMFVDCGILTSSPNITLNFEFGYPQSGSAPVISVGIQELIYNLTTVYGAAGAATLSEMDLPFINTCVLGIEDSGDNGPLLLGDPFLRSAYVVYDLTNNQIHIAQTNFDSTESEIVEITAGASTVTISSVQSTSTPHTSSSTSRSTSRSTAVITTLTTTGTATSTRGVSSSTTSSTAAAAVPPLGMGFLTFLLISGMWGILGGVWFLT